MASMPDLFISIGDRDKKAVDFLNELFWDASEKGISDIQLRFNEHLRSIRVEKVGDTVELFEPWGEIEDRDLYEIVDARLRSRAHIDSAARSAPTDGRIRLKYRADAERSKNKTLDLRVNIIPTEAGQTYVIRIQDAKFSLKPLNDIAMSESLRRVLESLLEEKQGIVVVCGPTGSGKTTLLFSLLLEFLRLKKNIKTVEHPPEYIVDGFDQVAVTERLSFAAAIRAFMRQRPHVILVGEVRDEETAEAVSQAGNTGHIVFCTTHADNSAAAIKRFIDLGMQRESVAQSLRLVIAQRLLESVDGEFAPEEFREPSETARSWLSSVGSYYPGDKFLELPRERMTGRVPIFEAFQVTPEVRTAIRGNTLSLIDVYKAAALQPQFETLAENAVRLAREGKTTLTEVHAQIGEGVAKIDSDRIDKVLLRDGAITPKQAHKAVEEQARRKHKGEVVALWEQLLTNEVASLHQIVDAVGKTDDAKNRIGYFREKEILTADQVEIIIKSWADANQAQSIFTTAKQLGLLKDEDIYHKALLYYRAPGMGALL